MQRARGIKKISSLGAWALGGVWTSGRPRWGGGSKGVLGTVDSGDEESAMVVFNFCRKL